MFRAGTGAYVADIGSATGVGGRWGGGGEEGGRGRQGSGGGGWAGKLGVAETGRGNEPENKQLVGKGGELTGA